MLVFAPFSSCFCSSLGWSPVFRLADPPSDAPSPLAARSCRQPPATHWREDRNCTQVFALRGCRLPVPILARHPIPLGARLHHPCITRADCNGIQRPDLFSQHIHTRTIAFPLLGIWESESGSAHRSDCVSLPHFQDHRLPSRTAHHATSWPTDLPRLAEREAGEPSPSTSQTTAFLPGLDTSAARQPSRDMQLPVRVSTICLHAHAPPLTGPFVSSFSPAHPVLKTSCFSLVLHPWS